MAGSTHANAEEPEWLTLYRARKSAEVVAASWLAGLGPEDSKEAEEDPPLARAKLRKAIVNSECPEVRADAKDGFKFTGAVMRAAEKVLGIPPPKAMSRSANLSDRVPKDAPSHFRPKLIIDGNGDPGTLGVWWSDYDTAKESERLREHCGVTHRLNMAIEVVEKMPEDVPSKEGVVPLKNIHIPMEDSFDPDVGLCEAWPNQLHQVLHIMRGLRDEGAVVNINCQMGKNRSGAAVLIWLCAECGWSLEDAVKHLRNITALACGNPHLIKSVSDTLGVSTYVPLNPAADGEGGWVCISPPGSPRAGAAEAFDADLTQKAAEALSRLGDAEHCEAGGAVAASSNAEGVEQEEEAGDMGALFSDLDDVD